MEMRPVFLFGEAERGEFCTPYLCRSLPQLADTLGNPPVESEGILYAVQALLYKKEVLFFRVKEEGFSAPDYMRGLKLLQSRERNTFSISAICLPGVGDAEILEATGTVCALHKSLLILSEKDLYDYLTTR